MDVTRKRSTNDSRASAFSVGAHRENAGEDEVSPAENGRRLRLSHAAAIALIAVLTLVAYFTLDRALDDGHRQARAIAATFRERVLLERIADLAVQYALGDGAVRSELRDAIGGFSAGYAKLDAAERSDENAAAFVTLARRVVALTPNDRSTTGAARAVLATARGAWVARLDAAVQTRDVERDWHADAFRAVAATAALGSIVTLGAETFGLFRPLQRRAKRLAHDVEGITRLATVDPLTGTLNKRGFNDRGSIEIHKARRYDRPLSLLAIDTDNFDSIAVLHGPGGSAAVLKALAASFIEGTRASDLVGHIGDGEFAILLPETGSVGAELLAERLRMRISERPLALENTHVTCTLSIGVAQAEKDAEFFWPTFQRADEALYEAKARGHNCVFIASA